jgi:predicted glycoside hydrolase/deacetylase ChbG (UPF0249 family)
MTLNEKLGYDQDARLLIVNADDFGMCHSTNQAIIQLLEEGAISSSTLMLPCPWAKEAALWSEQHPAYDVGVHLTLTSEWDTYKWGPVTRQAGCGSLVTDEGYFPPDARSVEMAAQQDEVRRELENQIRLALALGVKLTHADNHMGTVHGLATGRDFLDLVFDLCAAYGLPFRLPRHPRVPFSLEFSEEALAQSARQAAMADAKGVVILDYLLSLPFSTEAPDTYETFRNEMVALLKAVRPGVSELILHPSRVTDELKAIHAHAERRGMEWQAFRDPVVHAVIRQEGIRMIRWTDLQAVQRGRQA